MKMNKQKVFDKVFKALIKQGKRSLRCGFACQYRGADGCKCAVGHLICQKYYSAEFEGSNTEDPSVQEAVIKSLKISHFEGDDLDFLGYLQSAHDAATDDDFKYSFSKEMKSCAARFGLKFSGDQYITE